MIDPIDTSRLSGRVTHRASASDTRIQHAILVSLKHKGMTFSEENGYHLGNYMDDSAETTHTAIGILTWGFAPVPPSKMPPGQGIIALIGSDLRTKAALATSSNWLQKVKNAHEPKVDALRSIAAIGACIKGP